MTRILIALVLCAAPALAQAQGAPPPRPAAAAAIPAAQAQQALEVLRDDAKRAAFVATLQTIVAAQGAAPATDQGTIPAAAAAPPKVAAPLAPNGLSAQLMASGSEWLRTLSADIVATVRALTDFPLLANWVAHFATDADAQAALRVAAWRLLAVMAGALAADLIALRLVRGPARALEAHAPAGHPAEHPPEDEPEADHTARPRRHAAPLLLLRRLPFVLGSLALNLAPALAAGVAGYGLLGTRLGEDTGPRLVVLTVLDAYVVFRVIVAVARTMVAPGSPRMRILQTSDAGAAYCVRWVRRIVGVAVFGFALTEVALQFGLYQLSHDAVLKLVMLVVHVMLVIVVLQKRAAVAARLRGPEGATGAVATVRRRVARAWHVIAIFYIMAFWLVWAFEVPNGFARLVQGFLATLLIVTAARLIAVAVLGGLDRALRVGPELATRYPGLETRAEAYHPVARAVIVAVMTGLTGLALLEAWGVDALAWFSFGALGRRLVSALGVIGLTIVASVLLWEFANAGLQRHLDRLDRRAQLARAARLRTLLPMLRTTLLVVICLIAGLEVLSDIGVNIAPLLAGASVVGIAIGFGSQKLVQDVINGLFLLLENVMQVGDVVTLGGLSGTVEALSIRTIRLRALDGAVHVVPFSAVTTVTNMTRDYSYALLDISVGLNEEPGHVTEVVRAMGADMRAEPAWEAALRDDLDVMGVEKFLDTAYVLRMRIKTLPAQRWAVARELNRRIKARFDADGIESPMTAYHALATLPPPAAATAFSPAAESHA